MEKLQFENLQRKVDAAELTAREQQAEATAAVQLNQAQAQAQALEAAANAAAATAMPKSLNTGGSLSASNEKTPSAPPPAPAVPPYQKGGLAAPFDPTPADALVSAAKAQFKAAAKKLRRNSEGSWQERQIDLIEDGYHEVTVEDFSSKCVSVAEASDHYCVAANQNLPKCATAGTDCSHLEGCTTCKAGSRSFWPEDDTNCLSCDAGYTFLLGEYDDCTGTCNSAAKLVSPHIVPLSTTSTALSSCHPSTSTMHSCNHERV
jgi:hypothetical protein